MHIRDYSMRRRHLRKIRNRLFGDRLLLFRKPGLLRQHADIRNRHMWRRMYDKPILYLFRKRRRLSCRYMFRRLFQLPPKRSLFRRQLQFGSMQYDMELFVCRKYG